MPLYKIETMTITFQPLAESHFPLLLKWLEMAHVKKWWDKDVAYTLDLVREKYQPRIESLRNKGVATANKPIQCFIILFKEIPVGYIQLYNAYDFPREKPLSGLPQNLGAIDIFIGEEAYLKQGIGTKAISEFLEIYGNKYSHILADPDSKNIGAIKCYEKAGFKKTHEENGEIWMIKII